MKKYIIYLYLVIALILLNYWILFYHHSSPTIPIQNNSILVKQYPDSENIFLQKNPESVNTISHKKVRKLDNVSIKDSIRHKLALAYVDLSFVFLSHGNSDFALDLRNKALDIAGKSDLEINTAILSSYGFVSYRQVQSPLTSIIYQQARILSDKITDKNLHVQQLTDFANDYYRQDNTKKFEGYYFNTWQHDKGSFEEIPTKEDDVKDALDDIVSLDIYAFEKFNKKNNQNDYLMLCDQKIGDVFCLIEKYGEAIYWYKQALSLTIIHDNKPEIAKTYKHVAEMYVKIDDLGNANDAYIHFLKIEEPIGNKECMAEGYRSLGKLHFSLKNYTQSVYYFQKALQQDTIMHLSKETANDYAAISTIYNVYRQYEKAIEYSSKAEKSFQRINDIAGISYSYFNIGMLYTKLKN